MTALNEDIKQFPHVFPVEDDMNMTFDGVSRLIMLDRYAYKDEAKTTLSEGDLVVLTVKPDPSFPARGIGKVIDIEDDEVIVKLEEQYQAQAGAKTIGVNITAVDKPLEVFYEQISKRVAKGLAEVEPDAVTKMQSEAAFFEEIVNKRFVPAGRVLYGAGAGTDVTYFNCFVMPYPKDSREGIGEHRNEVMEIMSRGGGVGTNGSTLRPRHTLARGVNGKSSGSVSWLDDIAKLTHLVEQGGSRRGAQMIMLADWHPDILEFIISKMQNPRILRFIIETTEDDEIRELAQQKLKFTPLAKTERTVLEYALIEAEIDSSEYKYITELLQDGGRYSVNESEFLSGANISVAITDDFMKAVENDGDHILQFPDVENYNEPEMRAYNEEWHEVGDVRQWDLPVKTYRTIRAKELWNLINICATYAAEPGIFFMDNANEATNASAYGQQVVATNPCGEQPLAPYSVCNLAAVNLAEMVDKETREIDYGQLRQTVRTGVRMQDNVIDSTPYFLEANKQQALGERRIGLGVMGLADMLIYAGKVYGSADGNEVVDMVFEVIATEAYRESIELAKEKGSFPFLEDREAFANTGFMQNMPFDIGADVITHGIRNSHLLTVAPTGSTGSLIGVSTGLEPYFAFKYYRSGRLGKFMEVRADIVNELVPEGEDLPPEFVSAMELSPEAHVDVQTTIQRWVDSSLSKTVNAPKGYAVDQVQAIYERLYDGGAKGGTVYVDGSRDTQVLSLTADDSDDVNDAPKEDQEEPIEPVVFEQTVKELGSTSVNYGIELGETCPLCREGEVMEIGGCNTCSNCGTQLKCGL